jgi:cytochrome c oxidase subunit 1
MEAHSTHATRPGLQLPEKSYLNETTGIRSWLLTVDHKRIALLYLVSVTFFFFVGGFFAMMIRLHLLTPSGYMLSPDVYNRMFTMHGVTMVFFFLIPSIPAILGNFLIPLMVGAKDLAFPKINLLSWYIYIIGGAFTLYSMISGGLDTGWTFYTPLSTVYSNSAVAPAVIGVFITGFSMRAPGMTWFRLPIFVWSHYATSIVMILGTPVIAITLGLAAMERVFGLGFFNPAMGGDPILFQHLFWFYSHPAVYIMILPSMGVISELIPTFARKKIFGYEFVAAASLAIAVIGFLVWAHHMFLTGQSTYAAIAFSFLTFVVAIPSAIKTFAWVATLFGGSISFDTPMLYAFGFLGLFLVGGLTGLFLGALGLDIHIHDTYFVVAHFHYIMVGGAVMGYLGGLHFWWPKITGRMYPEWIARIAALILFVGFNLTFFPQFVLGYLGMPRRYHVYPPEFQVYNVMSTAGASILAIGYLAPMIYLTWAAFYGKVAGNNPWPATGLEWTTASPPPTENFHVTPVVTWDAYDFHNRPDLELDVPHAPTLAPAHGDD